MRDIVRIPDNRYLVLVCAHCHAEVRISERDYSRHLLHDPRCPRDAATRALVTHRNRD